MSEANKQAQSDKRLMSGRSMTEMLGVLALIAVLSIGAVMGLRYMMDKNKANRVLYDVNLGFAQIQGSENLELDTAYEASFAPESGYPVQIMRVGDATSQSGSIDTVLVGEIEQGVCNRLKEMKGTNGLSIYEYDEDTGNYKGYTTCHEDENIMYFAWGNINGICDKECPANQICQNGECGCPLSYELQGEECVYVECPSVVTDISLLEKEYCCSLQANTIWQDELCQCAPGYYLNEGICQATPKGFCIYNFGPPPSAGDVQYDCSYIYDNVADGERLGDYYSECSYTYQKVADGESLGAYKYDCYYNYELNADGTFSMVTDEEGKCPSDQYCVLNWTTQDCSSTVGALGADIIYGRCADRKYTYSQCKRENEIIDPELIENEPCPSDQYCVLNWTTQDCSSTVGALGADIIYGRCADRKYVYSQCKRENEIIDPELIENEPCPSDQYCILNWTTPDCSSTVSALGADIIYGRCADRKYVYSQCKAETPSNGFEGISAVQGCGSGQYCYLAWSSDECSNVSAVGAPYLYGICFDREETTPLICPVETSGDI